MGYIEENKVLKSFKKVRMIRTDDQKIKVSWQWEEDLRDVTIGWSNTPTTTDRRQPIIRVNGENSIIFDDPDPTRRNFFIVSATGYESEILAETILPFQGVSNFRDLGGYKTTDGRRIKWNIFYRSGELAGLTSDDVAYVKSLGIKTIFDYRSQGEVTNKPDPIIENIKNINISGMPSLDHHKGNFDMALLLKENKNLQLLEDPCSFLKKGYIEMVTSNQAFKKMIQCIEDPKQMPIIQHCTAGKDRTGFGSALLLLTLGVSEEVVIEDYLLTNQYRIAINKSVAKSLETLLKNEKSREKFKLLMEARREYIESSLHTIKEKYGSIQKYLMEEYGLDEQKIDRLQQYYLE